MRQRSANRYDAIIETGHIANLALTFFNLLKDTIDSYKKRTPEIIESDLSAFPMEEWCSESFFKAGNGFA
ncbi:hypothetical protein TCA2_2745 [Paenibacillus sp. TCA20]|nr:hypothetical protein TCA2_2745 [Paenibacillus sp. TCA20]